MSGDTSEIYEDQVPTIEPQISEDFQTVMKWANETHRMHIKANAETLKDFGVEGIGLVFFDPKRIVSFITMILADNDEEKWATLAELLPCQTGGFEALFKIKDGYPVTIRLLDPLLHEFLPKADKDIKDLALEMKVSEELIRKRIVTLHELYLC